MTAKLGIKQLCLDFLKGVGVVGVSALNIVIRVCYSNIAKLELLKFGYLPVMLFDKPTKIERNHVAAFFGGNIAHVFLKVIGEGVRAHNGIIKESHCPFKVNGFSFFDVL